MLSSLQQENIRNAFTMMTTTSIFFYLLLYEMVLARFNILYNEKHVLSVNFFLFRLRTAYILCQYKYEWDQYGDWYLSEYLVLPSLKWKMKFDFYQFYAGNNIFSHYILIADKFCNNTNHIKLKLELEYIWQFILFIGEVWCREIISSADHTLW